MTLEEAIKHARDVAENNSGGCEECIQEHKQLAEWLEELKQLREQVKRFQWIPVKLRPTTEEDCANIKLYPWFIESPIPDVGEEILISRSGCVYSDTNLEDELGVYLEDWGDWTSVDAWMPLPKPYRGGDEK